MNAILSFVPTPSALDTSTGSRYRSRSSAKSPPKDPISERTPGVKVLRASDLIRRTVSLPASMSTPALSVIRHQKSRLPMRVCIRSRAGDPSFEPQYVRRTSAKKRSLSRSSSSMSKPSPMSAMALRAIGMRLESVEHERGVAERGRAEGKRHGGARGIARRNADRRAGPARRSRAR